jgi:3-deoxy-D-manno-octulosonic-acid transferase
MDRGNSYYLLHSIGYIESFVLSVLRPIIMRFSAKFAERELIIDQQIIGREFGSKSVWIHVASLGEFEQAVPIIEHLKQNGSIDITLTFSSPSGYNIRKYYELVDRVLYLPLDTKRNAQKFIHKLRPDCAIFIRYELWINYLLELNAQDIPVFYINATYPRSVFWRIIPFILRSILHCFSYIITVNKQETEYFLELHLDTPIQTGSDTRLDRISSRVSQILQHPLLIHEICPIDYSDDDTVIVLGSSWSKDEHLFLSQLPNMPTSLRFIIVPHEPDDLTISRLKKECPHSGVLSELKYGDNPKHVIVDSVGKLMVLYAIADAVYIGGGFGIGVHSCAEPAGFGVPLACGPFVHRSPDAIALHALGALDIIHTEEEAYRWMMQIVLDNKKHAADASATYIKESAGMTSKVIDLLHLELYM